MTRAFPWVDPQFKAAAKRLTPGTPQLDLDLDEPVPRPDNLREYLAQTRVPHIDRPAEKVAGITAIQDRILRESTLFRLGLGRRRIRGSCIIGKARRVFGSSLIQRAFEFFAATEPETEWYTVCHDAKTAANLEQFFGKIILGLPEPSWADPWRWRGGRWEYVHERGPGGPETDVVATYQVLLAGKTLDDAGGLGRGRRMDGCHVTEAPKFRYPAAVFSAIEPCVPEETGQLVYESTFGGDGCWYDERWHEAAEGRGKFLAALFYAWHDDPLKVIGPDDPRHDRALAIPVDDADLEVEQRLGLTLPQIAFRRWHRCQGDADARHAAAVEYPETPEDAVVKPDLGWIPRAPLDLHEERWVCQPGLRVLVAPDLALSVWDRAPESLALGLVRRHDRGRSYLFGVGLNARTLDQVLEINGEASDGQGVLGVALTLYELGLLGTKRTAIAIGLPEGKTLVEAFRRADRATITPATPRRGDWSRLPPGDLSLAWDLSPMLWGPRRKPGESTGAIGWTLTGYHLSTMMADRLRPAVTDPDGPLRIRSQYWLRELRGLVLSARTGEVEGRPYRALCDAGGLALMAAADVPQAPSFAAWAAVSQPRTGSNGGLGPPI